MGVGVVHFWGAATVWGRDLFPGRIGKLLVRLVSAEIRAWIGGGDVMRLEPGVDM